MSSPVRAASEALRVRLSSPWMLPAPRAVDEAILRTLGSRPSRDLAAPPPGSGLRPVPGDYGLPLVGHFAEYLRYGGEFSRRRYERYGPVSWMGGPGLTFVMVGGPEATRVVLANTGQDFSQEGWRLRGQGVFFRRGLLLLDFDEHRYHRRIMQPAFSAKRLGGYVDLMSPRARASVQTWPVGRSFRMYPALKALTLDVATRAFMGGPAQADMTRIRRAFVDTLRGNTALVMKPLPGTRWRRAVKGRAELERYFAQQLPGRRTSASDDLFSALCAAVTEDDQRFSDEDIIDHMIFMMMAAHDTAASTATAVAYQLARHPEWQEAAREETLARGQEPLGLDAVEQLEVLDRVIKEALRLLAPVPVFLRTAVRDTEILGYYIPKGTHVSLAPQLNHLVADSWTEPDRFDPDRFGPERREDRADAYAWIPFGMGAHKCIGMRFGVLEVKILLHEMLRAFRWELAGDYTVRWDHTSLPLPSNGLPVRLSPLPPDAARRAQARGSAAMVAS